MPFVEKRKQCNIKSPRTKSYLVALSCILIHVYFDTQNFKPGRVFKVNESNSLLEEGEMSPERMIFQSGSQASCLVPCPLLL